MQILNRLERPKGFIVTIALLLLAGSNIWAGTLLTDDFTSQASWMWNYSSTATVTGGKLQFSYNGIMGMEGVSSYGLVYWMGDFDFQIDYDASAMAGNNWYQGLRAWRASSTQWSNGGILNLERQNYSSQNYFAGYWNGSAWTSTSSVGTSDWTGKLRLTRVGATTKVYYWNNSLARWEWNGSTAGLTVAGFGTDNVYVTIGGGNPNNSVGYSVLERYDNFVALGQNTLPEPSTVVSLLFIAAMGLGIPRLRSRIAKELRL